jgi:hypothetical protein
MSKNKTKEKDIDETLEETFPASDPPSWMPGEATIPEKKPKDKK